MLGGVLNRHGRQNQSGHPLIQGLDDFPADWPESDHGDTPVATDVY
jgi:hypothetical protein